MASILRKQSPKLSFADEVLYKESLSNCNLDNSFPESFIIGDKVWLNGIYPGRIQYIGEVHFGHGDDWAGLVLDEPIGKHDGSVNGQRYYYCENKKGLFTKLSKLTRVPLRAQESPDSGITYSPTHSNRQRHFSSPSPILKNSPNRINSQSNNQLFTPKKITPKRISISPIDRSYEYYYESDKKNTSRDRHLNRLNDSKEFSDFEKSLPYVKLSPSSASSYNLNYFRTSRSSTPINRPTYRSHSIGSREPRIHHIKIELETDNNNNKNEFKIPLKKSCSEEIIEKPVLKLGDFVYVDSSKGLLPGKLRYLGPTDFKEGHWAGVELDLPYGRHNGKVEGKRYFTCKKNHGLFAPCFKVHKANPKYFGKTQKNIRFADDV